MEAGRIAAGSGRAGAAQRVSAAGTPLRLDPFSLPVRFAASDAAADGCLRVVDLHRERVVVRRAVRGMRMAVSMPVKSYRGVAIRLLGDGGNPPTSIAVVLEHGDPALSLPLYAASASEDILAEWQAWGRVLGLPLLVAEADGSLHEPFARLGMCLRIEPPIGRRRRRSALARRRPLRLLRRRPGVWPQTPRVHRNEREIIARN